MQRIAESIAKHVWSFPRVYMIFGSHLFGREIVYKRMSRYALVWEIIANCFAMAVEGINSGPKSQCRLHKILVDNYIILCEHFVMCKTLALTFPSPRHL